MATSSLDYLTTSLQVPSEFSRSEHISDEETLSRLETWKTKAHQHLSELRTLLKQNAPALSLQEQARVISSTAVFDGDGPWISLASQELCRGMFFLPPGTFFMAIAIAKTDTDIDIGIAQTSSDTIASPRCHCSHKFSLTTSNLYSNQTLILF